MLTSQLTAKPSALAWRTSATPAALLMRHKCTRAPVARISSKMVCMAMVSAITGTPLKPMRVANGPLAATPWPRSWSCGRSQTAKPKVLAYCRARCSTWVLVMALSAWLNATQPTSVNMAISVRLSPFRPRVSAPSG